MPNTLSDCLRELIYWDALYSLRHADDPTCWDGYPEVRCREQFVFGLLAQRRKRSKSEGIAVFRYLAEGNRSDWNETKAILLNLI